MLGLGDYLRQTNCNAMSKLLRILLKPLHRATPQDDAISRLDPEIRRELRCEAKSAIRELDSVRQELHRARRELEETRDSEVFVSTRLTNYREKLVQLSNAIKGDKDKDDDGNGDDGDDEENNLLLQRAQALEEALHPVEQTLMDLLANIIRLENTVEDLERKEVLLEKVVHESSEFQAILKEHNRNNNHEENRSSPSGIGTGTDADVIPTDHDHV